MTTIARRIASAMHCCYVTVLFAIWTPRQSVELRRRQPGTYFEIINLSATSAPSYLYDGRVHI